MNQATEPITSERLSQSQRKAIIVLGMHRSGTSVLTRTLSLLGAALPRHILGANATNPSGHWEARLLVDLHDRMLIEAGSCWDDWRPFDPGILGSDRLAYYKGEIARIIASEYGDAPLILIKDPRICRFVPLYESVLAASGIEPLYVITQRNPLAVIASLARRNDMTPAFAGLLWLRHMFDASVATRHRSRVFISYESFLDDWRLAERKIAKALKLTWPRSVEGASAEIDGHIDKGLQHHTAGLPELQADPLMSHWVKEGYAAYLKLLGGEEDEALSKLSTFKAEFDSAATIFSEANSAELKIEKDKLNGELAVAHRQVDASKEAIVDMTKKLETAADWNRTLDGQMARNEELISELAQIRRYIDEEMRREKRDRRRMEKHNLELQAQIVSISKEYNSRLDNEADRRAEIERKLVYVEDRYQAATARITDLTREIAAGAGWASQATALDETLAEVFASTSWQVTKPLRAASRMVRRSMSPVQELARRNLQLPKALSAPAADKKSPTLATCYIATTPHTEFVANLMADCLREEGFQVKISNDLADNHGFEHLFVLCPQMFPKPDREFSAFQMEQSVNSRWFSEVYFGLLSKAETILDYSIDNIDFLQKNGVENSRIFYSPIGPSRRMLPYGDNYAKGNKTVLFYGDDQCIRRRYIIDRLKEKFDINVVNNRFGDELYDEIGKSCAVINIHYYEGALLETTRVYEALSCGVPVISEKGADHDRHEDLHGLVDFVDVGDIEGLIDKIGRVVSSAEYRDQKVEQIREYIRTGTGRFEAYFRRYLLGRGMIAYSGFDERALGYAPETPSPTPYICLTLPETPERQRAFLSQGHKGFVLWDGLKARPGWVGCALSYKQIFQQLRDRGATAALICEDDALLPPDFENETRRILEYLESLDAWDVFSGFIADVSKETEITRVDEVEDRRYIHIDRTVSTVFNIYNKNIIEYLAEWDIEDRNVERNTIDRYLERRKGTVVVTTFPFFVGHRDDLVSAVWGFQNTQYNEMVSRSISVFEKKIENYITKSQKDFYAVK